MSCAKSPACSFEEVPLDAIKVEWDGPAKGRKAVAYPNRRTIYLDSTFWKSLRSVDARAAILAHERGHIEGAKCEPCADYRAGVILAREGTQTPRDAARALAGRLDNRDGDAAANALLDGFGLDEVQGPGYLMNASRADGVEAPLRQFLAQLHREGLYVNGVTYSLTVGVQGGVRTDSEQLALYRQGRAQLSDDSWVITDASKVVTNASSSRNGKHGQRKAVDVWVVMPDGAPLLFKSQAPALFDAAYAALGAKGEARGLTWGGRFQLASGPDLPHFEINSGTAGGLFPLAGLVAALLLLGKVLFS